MSAHRLWDIIFFGLLAFFTSLTGAQDMTAGDGLFKVIAFGSLVSSIIAWIGRQVFTPRNRPEEFMPDSRPLLVFSAFLGWVGVSLLWSPHEEQGRQILLNLLLLDLPAFLLLSTVLYREGEDGLRTFAVATLGVSMLVGILAMTRSLVGGLDMPFGLSLDVTAKTAALGALLCWDSAREYPSRRWLWVTVGSVAAGLILVNRTLSGALILVMGLGVMLPPRRLRAWVWLGALLLAFMLSLLSSQSSAPSGAGYGLTVEALKALGKSWIGWIRDPMSVLTGMGLGASHAFRVAGHPAYPHNLVLQLFTDAGLVGVGFLLVGVLRAAGVAGDSESSVGRLVPLFLGASLIAGFFGGDISGRWDLWGSWALLSAARGGWFSQEREASPGGRKRRSVRMVSVIMPCRNERGYIAACLDSLLAQTWPAEKMEILVADGMSDDGTRGILRKYARATKGRVKVLDNPGRTTPKGLNLCLRRARGNVILRVDTHAWYPPDYVETCVDVLRRTGAWNVGGYIVTRGKTYFGEAVALALGSVFGVGGSRFRVGNYEGEVETVPFGAFPSWVFRRVGLFNEALDRNQDAEFNGRIRKAGGKVYLSRRIRSVYYTRDSLPALVRYFYRNSAWNVLSVKKAGYNFLRWRHFLPSVALLMWVMVAVLKPPVAGVLAAGYLFLDIVFSLDAAMRGGWKFLPLLPWIFALIHISYALGTYDGIYTLLFKKRAPSSG